MLCFSTSTFPQNRIGRIRNWLGEIQKNCSTKIKHLDLFKSISSRKEIDFETYEKLHNKEITDPIIDKESISLERIESIENKTGYRIYN